MRKYHFVTLLLALLTAAYFTRELLLPIVIAIILTLTLLPVVRFGERFGVPAVVTAVSLIVAMSLIFVQLGYILSGPAQTLATDAPRIAGEVREKLGGLIDRVSDLQHSAKEITGGTTAPDLIDPDGDGVATTPVVAVIADSAGLAGELVSALASTGGAIGAANEFVDYAASKGAVESMTISLSKEVAAFGIRVNAIRPVLIDTDMQRASGEADRLIRLLATVPMGRAGRADEVAEAVIWLLSAAASNVTGAILPVSGGR